MIPKRKNNVVKSNKNEITANTNKNIIKEETVDGIKYSNISMLTEKGYTTFSSDVTNISDKDITNEKYYIVLKDKNNKQIIRLLAYIPNGLKKGETKTVTARAHGTFNNAVTKEITK